MENERPSACGITFVHRQSDRDHARDDVVKKIEEEMEKVRAAAAFFVHTYRQPNVSAQRLNDFYLYMMAQLRKKRQKKCKTCWTKLFVYCILRRQSQG